VIKLRVPATSANLGPGFDCLGLALDLWNEVAFEPDDHTSYLVHGEGAGFLEARPSNLLLRAVQALYAECGANRSGLRITAENHIPLSSGLGSSAAAIVAGLLGANAMLGHPLDKGGLLRLGAKLEGHPDNVSAALLGGLVVSVQADGEILAQRYSLPELTAVIVKPDVDLSTRAARAVLPKMVSREDAVFNIGRTALVVEALRSGDRGLLQKAMEDRLHQSYRLAHIPSGEEAYERARGFGAAALSGAGPSIIAFVEPDLAPAAGVAVAAVFERRGISTRSFILHTSNTGAELL
jgi:homoserine kinase